MRHLKAGLVAAGLIGAVVAIAPQANANPFNGFTFNNQVTGTPQGSGLNPKKDIYLQSVTFGNKTINSFELVQGANIITNTITKPTAGEHGPASSDRGDLVSAACPAVDAGVTGADIVGSLGNLNLNCIVDTEDNLGTSVIDVLFNPRKFVNTFFLFERGKNSNIQVEGIDMNGSVVASPFIISYQQWADAGYKIDTTEITKGAQAVGSYGLKSNVYLKGLRLSSKIGFNGPDFKVVAAHVPEPASMLGLGLVSSAAVMMRRRKQKVG